MMKSSPFDMISAMCVCGSGDEADLDLGDLG
jgi:hypothetical protein